MGRDKKSGQRTGHANQPEGLFLELCRQSQRLSVGERARLAQYLINTDELIVAITSRASVSTVVQRMNQAELGELLELVSRRLTQVTG